MTAVTVKLSRVFRIGTTDFPDPDSDLTPDQVLEHYTAQYPSLRHGKVEEVGAEGDRLVFALKPAEFKANG